MKKRFGLALVLSILVPGGAHAWLGRPRQALLLGLLHIAAALNVGVLLLFPASRILVWAVAIAPTLVVLLSVVWALALLKHSTSSVRPLPVVAYFLAIHFLAGGCKIYSQTQWGRLYRIGSASMQPLILPGDTLFARNAKESDFKAGELALYQDEKGQNFIKRIVGMPGDKIEIEDRSLRINEKPVVRWERQSPAGLEAFETFTEELNGHQYVILYSHHPPPGLRRHRRFTVPAGHVFVLGDNRDESLDSSLIGTLPMERLRAKPKVVWFSRSPGREIRWGRVGKSLNQGNREES